MFRLTFLLACLLYIWIGSLFTQTTHQVAGERHIFSYSVVAIIFGFGFNVIPIAGAWFLWKIKKDRIGTGIILLCIPLFAFFIMPQLFMERVEVTPTLLIHRREPPHTRFNADIAFDDITSAVEFQFETGLKGYNLKLKNGRIVELPANTVLTAARDTISAQLQSHQIPVVTETVRQQRAN